MTAEDRAGTSRRLIVFRHSKADWPSEVRDHDRPLANRGRGDAQAAGRWLRRSGGPLDLVVCSTAKRTRQTWSLAARELADAPPVTYEERVYDASAPLLLDVVRETSDAIGTLVLVGHNPGVHQLVLTLAGDGEPDALRQVQAKFGTSAIAVLDLATGWDTVVPGAAVLGTLTVPRG